MKDAVATMGAILPDDAKGRDAVHVAVMSVVAKERLFAGMDVGLDDTMVNGERVASSEASKTIGIVDPFIRSAVQPGQRFWLFLFPRTITGLCHRWTHPDIPDDAVQVPTVYAPPSSKLASEEWLKNFCESNSCPEYKTVMELIEKGELPGDPDDGYGSARMDGDSLTFYGRDAHGDIPPEFWDHVEIVLGKKIEGSKPTYFSCSC